MTQTRRARLPGASSRWFSTIAAGLALLLVGACKDGQKQSTQSEAGSKAVAEVPWTVRVGSQGGFTGGSSGHLVHSDGTVQSWSQIVPSDSVSFEIKGRTDKVSLEALVGAITDPTLVALQHEETGNMTNFLSWSQGATLRRWSWAERADETKLPPPLEKAYVAALTAVEKARP